LIANTASTRSSKRLGSDRLGAVEVREHRPLVDAVIDGDLFPERADVIGDVRQECPQLEVADAEPQAKCADRGAQDLPVDRARERAGRQRQDQRREHPEVVLDVLRPARELGQLAADLAQVATRRQLRRAGC
jgi:hypothetical protein